MNSVEKAKGLAWLALCVMTIACWNSFASAQTDLSVPMDRDLVTVSIRLGLGATEPTTWTGTYRLDKGEIIATDGLRFTGEDYATTSEFRVDVRRYYPRFWNRRGRSLASLPMEPNGFLLTCSDVQTTSVLQLETSQGDVTIPIGKLRYGRPQRTLNDQVEYRRVPTARHIVRGGTEDGYPSAAISRDGTVHVVYVSFTHGVGFETRLPITTDPEDYSYLAKPTGGDRLWYVQLKDGQWSEPEALTPPNQDLFCPTVTVDGGGTVWVFWAENVDDNWDVFAIRGSAGSWSKPVKLSRSPETDFDQRAAVDAEGRVWVAWQSFQSGRSEIVVARQEGDGFSEPEIVSRSAANDWSPAIAASADGQVAVAWDSYDKGNYDVFAKVWSGGSWKAERTVAATLFNEARPDVAFDSQNRLWVAYEISPEGWGKDFGPYDQSPKRMPLYRSRSIGVKVLHGDGMYAPKADVVRALPLPNGQTRFPRAGDNIRAASPRLAVDVNGRVFLAVRNRLERYDSGIGGTWMTYLTTVDAQQWRPAVMIPQTDGFLHETSSLVPAPGGGLYIVSASDGRFRSAALFNQPRRVTNQRSGDAPPPSTRDYPEYPDRLFNKEISFADTGSLAKAPGDLPLVAVTEDKPHGPTDAAKQEAEDVARIREYRAQVGGKSLRIVRGEFHRHTEVSGDGAGDGTLFDMWRYAIDMASLDWIGNGDHDNGNGREFSWWFTQKTTSMFNFPEAFTSMYTYERSVSYPDGHRNAVFARRGIRPLPRLQGGMGKRMDELPPEAPRPHSPDTQMFYKYLRFFDGVCASHTSATDMGTDWRDNDPKVEPIVEIYQGDRQNYERPGAPRSNTEDYSIGGWRPYGFVSLALMKGYRLGFQSSSDHISTHMSYCNVWVEQPTREAILEGMKARHVYGATDNIIADVRCGKHFMGDEFTTSEKPTIRVKLIGTAPFAEVVIVKDNEYVYSTNPQKQTVEFEWTDHAAESGKTSYYYVRGTQVGETTKRKVNSPSGERVEVELNNGEIVWVSPMWITYQP